MKAKSVIECWGSFTAMCVNRIKTSDGTHASSKFTVTLSGYEADKV